MNRVELGNKIRERRDSLKLSRESVIDIIGDDQISYRTIVRIESGDDKVSPAKVDLMLHALGMDEYLKDGFYNIGDYLVHRQIDANHVIYPYTDLAASMNLWLDLFVYLPLIPPRWLADTIQRIGEPWFGREYYIAIQIQKLIARIPDTPAKKYAENILRNLTTDSRNLQASRRSTKKFSDYYHNTYNNTIGADEYQRAQSQLIKVILLADSLYEIQDFKTNTSDTYG